VPATRKFTESLSLFVEPELKAQIDAVVERDGIGMSKVLRRLLRTGLETEAMWVEAAETFHEGDRYDVELPFSA